MIVTQPLTSKNTVMPDSQVVFSEIEQQIIDLANSSVGNYRDQAIADAKQLLNDLSEDLRRWAKLLRSGKITKAEFEWLVNSSKQLVDMPALEQAGLSPIRIERFAVNVLNIIGQAILRKING
jgi:hypothetical protein